MHRGAALLLGLLLALLPLGCAPGREGAPLHGAVLVVFDTLAADHVSAYGAARRTTPNLDALAKEGVLFEAAISNSSWTLPALTGLLSGRWPSAAVFDRRLKSSLVETLGAAGIATAAFTEGGFASRFYGLDRGFGHFVEEESAIRLKVDGAYLHAKADGGIERTFAAARAWLREHHESRFFLLVHSYETHAPYRRRSYAQGMQTGGLGATFELADVGRLRNGELPASAELMHYLRALYDGGVRQADAQLGELLATLDELGRAGDTLVVVTSDHGEELSGRLPRWSGDHGHVLYDELVRVPLVLRDPGREYPTHRVAQQVRNLDILPTVLERLGVALPEDVDGRSLLPLLEGRESEPRRALAELTPSVGKPPRRALRDGRYKLIVNDPDAPPRRPAVELFDLQADPGERHNLSEDQPELAQRLGDELAALLEESQQPGPPDYRDPEELPADLRERLESLGYTR